MSHQAAMLVWTILGAYGAAGLCVAAPMITFGLERIDPAAGGMPVRVRLLILPGLVALWPLMLFRLAGRRPAEDRLAKDLP